LKSENELSNAFKLAHRFTGGWKRECDVRKLDVQRKLTAILSAEVVGYSLPMGEDD